MLIAGGGIEISNDLISEWIVGLVDIILGRNFNHSKIPKITGSSDGGVDPLAVANSTLTYLLSYR
jgi:hypothetical protein